MSHESTQPDQSTTQQLPGLRFDTPHKRFNVPQLAVNQVTTYRWSLEQDLENYRKAGVGGIGVWRKKINECGEDAAVEAIIDSCLPVSSVSFAGGFTGSMGFRLEEAITDSIDAIRLASVLNAKCVLVATGSKWQHIKSNAIRLVDDGLKRLADFAADSGVKLALAPMCSSSPDQFSFLTDLNETLDAIDRCNHPSVGLAFSSFHHCHEADVVNRLAEISHLVASVQLSDCRRSADGVIERCAIGEGEIPLAAMVRTMVENRYDGSYELDIWSDKVWGADYSVLLPRQVEFFEELLSNAAV